MRAAMQYDSDYTSDLVFCEELGACVGRVGFPCTPSSPVAEAAVIAITAGEPGVRPPDGPKASVPVGGVGFSAGAVALLYLQGGIGGLSQVEGPFSAFVFDRRNTTGHLLTDRYGSHRLFARVEGQVLYFSSEAKAILAVVPGSRTFSLQGLSELLACGCTLGSQSLFDGIEVLEGGTVISFDSGGKRNKRKYFQPSALESLSTAPDGRAVDGFQHSLRAAVEECATSAPRAAISLTGGLDSRIIVASLDETLDAPCYTFGSMYRTTADVAISSRVARCLGLRHEVIELGKAFLYELPELLSQSVYISDGYIGLSGAAELYVNKVARNIAGARITGNWGGELLRGVRAFKYNVPKGGFLQPFLLEQMSQSAQHFTCAAEAHPLTFVLFRQMPMQGYGRSAVERSQVRMRSPFLRNDVVNWLYRLNADLRASRTLSSTVVAQRAGLVSIPTDIGLLGSGPESLRRLRRGVGKVRAKLEYVTSHGSPDWLARFAAALPPGVIETRFLGYDKFQHFRWWMRTEIASFVREALQPGGESALSYWFDRQRLSAMVEQHVKGACNYTEEIDKALTLRIAETTLFSARTFSGGFGRVWNPPALRGVAAS